MALNKNDDCFRPDKYNGIMTVTRMLLPGCASLLLAIVMLAVVFHAGWPIKSGDVFWQVRTGNMILTSKTIPDTDSFTYTVSGTDWNNHQWGYEILVSLLQKAFGWGGLRLTVLILFSTVTIGILLRVSQRADFFSAVAVTTCFVMLASYKFTPSPQLLAMVLFFGAFRYFRGADTLTSPLKYGLLCLFMLIWGNLTAEALIFLPFLCVDQAGDILGRRSASVSGNEKPHFQWKKLLLLGVVCLMPFITPPQSSVLNYALEGSQINRMVNAEFLHLWERCGTVWPAAKHLAQAIALIFTPYALLCFIKQPRRFFTQLRTMGPGLLAVAAAVMYERYIWMLVLCAARMAIDVYHMLRKPFLRRTAETGILILVATVFAFFLQQIQWTPAYALSVLGNKEFYRSHLDANELPLQCVEYIRKYRTGAHLFTTRLWAGYVIWRAPGVFVFIDGRNREFPLKLHQARLEVLHGGPQAGRVLSVTGTNLVLAPKGWHRKKNIRKSGWAPEFFGYNCEVCSQKR